MSNYLEVEHPHGFLIWRGKQTAIANNTLLPEDELLVVCNNEAYGRVKLAQPMAVSLSEFERLEDEHCIRPEERKMLWPEAQAFFVHQIKSFEPFEQSLPVKFANGGVAEIIRQDELSADENELIKQAERLPKTIVVDDDAVVLDGEVIQMTSKIDYLKMLQSYEATIGQKGIQGRLPLYKLALIRHPHLVIERKEAKQMPYEIMESHEECEEPYAVVKAETGELMGCHATEEEAQAQIVALNISENMPMMEEDSAEEKQFDNSEWDGAASNWDTADAYCRDSLIDVNPSGEDKVKDLCFLPYRKPGADNPNINSLRTMPTGRGIVALERPDGVEAERWDSQVQAAANKLIGWWPDAFDKPAPASIYRLAGKEPPEGSAMMEEEEKTGARLKKTWRQRLQDAYETIKEMLSWADYDDAEGKQIEGKTGFRIKQINGEPWFFAWSTNAFEDREGEIFSTKALEKYVQDAEKNSDRGFFNLWHIGTKEHPELTDFAKKEWQGVIGRILVEAGPFTKDAKGKAALQFFKQHPTSHPELAPEGWGCSPEYRFLPEDRDDKIYDWVWITRTSVLAKAAAANIYTKGGLQMALTEDQAKAAEEVFGKELAGQIIKDAEGESKELEQAGVAHKSEKEEKQEQPAITIETVVEELVKKLDLTTALGEIVNQVDELKKSVDERFAKLEKTEAVKQQNDITRYMFKLTRASEAEETKVEDGDKLKTQKPKETQEDKSLAGTFFQQPK